MNESASTRASDPALARPADEQRMRSAGSYPHLALPRFTLAAMSARTPEGRITASIIDAINRLPGARAHKVAGGPYGSAGEPDVDACVSGRAVKLEVKQPKARRNVTPQQRLSLMRWEAAGAVCAVVCSRDEALDVLADAGLIDGRLVPGEHPAVTQFWRTPH